MPTLWQQRHEPQHQDLHHLEQQGEHLPLGRHRRQGRRLHTSSTPRAHDWCTPSDHRMHRHDTGRLHACVGDGLVATLRCPPRAETPTCLSGRSSSPDACDHHAKEHHPPWQRVAKVWKNLAKLGSPLLQRKALEPGPSAAVKLNHQGRAVELEPKWLRRGLAREREQALGTMTGPIPG